MASSVAGHDVVGFSAEESVIIVFQVAEATSFDLRTRSQLSEFPE
jgi:hypothetical protein